MSLPNYIPIARRSAVGKRWAAAKFEKRVADGLDDETAYRRALDDARGQVIREGATYRSTGITLWCIRRSLHGRTKQFDFLANDRLKLTGGPRRFPRWARP